MTMISFSIFYIIYPNILNYRTSNLLVSCGPHKCTMCKRKASHIKVTDHSLSAKSGRNSVSFLIVSVKFLLPGSRSIIACIGTANLTITLPFTLDVTILVSRADNRFWIAAYITLANEEKKCIRMEIVASGCGHWVGHWMTGLPRNEVSLYSSCLWCDCSLVT